MRWIALFLLIGCGGPQTTTPADDVASATVERDHPWPMFRGGPTHVGDASLRGTPAWRERWRVELGERIDASIVIDVDGRAIVLTRKGMLVAIDSVTGKLLVEKRLPAGVWSSPVLVGDVLVAAADDGTIAAFDRSWLNVIWRRAAPSKSYSSLSAAGGVVYLCSGRHLLAIEAAANSVLFDLRLEGSCFTAPAIDENTQTVVVGDRAGRVTAVHARSGAIRWTATTSDGAHNDGSPVIAGGRVLIGSNDKSLHALELATGAPVWRWRSERWVVSTPAVVDGRVFVGNDGGVIAALDLTSGDELWRGQVGDDLASSPTVVGTLVVHGAHDGKLHARDRQTGGALDSIDIGSAAYSSVAIARDGAVLIGTHEGAVVAVE